MPLVCPICYSEARELEHTSDATGYSCPTHGNFKVAGSVFPEARAKDYTREEWEAALDNQAENGAGRRGG